MRRKFLKCAKCGAYRQHTLSEDGKHWVCKQCGTKVEAK